MSLLLDRSVARDDPRIETGVHVAGLGPEALVRDHGLSLIHI